MAAKRSNNDIELKDLKEGVKSGFNAVGMFVFRCLRFLLKRALVIGILLLAGIGLGLIWQLATSTPQKAELLVKLNAGSTAYVYNAVENFEQSSDFPHIQSVQIEPVVDLAEILEKFKVLDDEQIMMFLDEVNSSKPLLKSEALRSNYELHKIDLIVDENANSEDATGVLKLFSQSEYYQKQLAETQKINTSQIESNTFAIAQIDSMLINMNRSLKETKGGGTYTNYEDFDLASLLWVKDSIFKKNRLLIAQNRVGNCLVCVVNTPKLTQNKTLFHYKALWLPILLITVYLLLSVVIRFYQKTASRIDE
ncbi:MAG: hypothetical protein COA80_04615 [Leeuwenhoekiella sp.]|nr:MAG: hypothetical protein COA80_04615 [Leeuwenhoekiella sp.]